jgi:hypothetical protein
MTTRGDRMFLANLAWNYGLRQESLVEKFNMFLLAGAFLSHDELASNGFLLATIATGIV